MMFLRRDRGAFTGSFTVVKNIGDQKFEVNLGIGVTNTTNLATGHQLTDDGDCNACLKDLHQMMGLQQLRMRV